MSRTWGTRPHGTVVWPIQREELTAGTPPSAPPIRRSTQPPATSTPRGTTLSCGSIRSSTTRRSATPMSCPSGRWASTASRRRTGTWRGTCGARRPRLGFAFITPNLCSDGHDSPCAGRNSTGGRAGGLTGADEFLRAWMPTILSSPAYKHGDTLVVITFDEADVDRSDPAYAAACCGETTGPNTHAPGNAGLATDTAPGGGQIGALLLNPKYLTAGLDRHDGLLQPLLSAAQLRGPPRTDDRRDRWRGPPGLCRGKRTRAIRDGRFQQPCRSQGTQAQIGIATGAPVTA